MKTYRVVEVQLVTRMREWVHEIEAESPEEAIKGVHAGDGELVNEGDDIGEEDYGESGFAIDDGTNDATEEALADFNGERAAAPAGGAE